MSGQKSVISHTMHGIWQTELALRLNNVITIAKVALIDRQSKDNPELLQSLINGVEAILGQVTDGTLTPPDGQISLGIGRYVSDWVDDLQGPLSIAVATAEIHYTKGAAANATHAQVSAMALNGRP
jgi:hypothetical protein